MDKYEFNIKLEQIKKLAAKKEYKQAAQIAKEMNWNKVKDWSTLATVINVQEAAGDYEEARDMAILAYNRNLGGRKLIYKLTEFFIKVNDFENAEELYKEYAKISAHDVNRYILYYDLRRAQGAPDAELVKILEDYKESEIDEKYMYELANLYYKTGRREDCIKTCDNLVLWFQDGVYVENAVKLKEKLGVNLSNTQRRILGEINARKSDEEANKERMFMEQKELARLKKDEVGDVLEADELKKTEPDSVKEQPASEAKENIASEHDNDSSEDSDELSIDLVQNNQNSALKKSIVKAIERQNEANKEAAAAIAENKEKQKAVEDNPAGSLPDSLSESLSDSSDNSFSENVSKASLSLKELIENAKKKIENSCEKISREDEEEARRVAQKRIDEQADAMNIEVSVPNYSIYDTHNIQEELAKNVKNLFEDEQEETFRPPFERKDSRNNENVDNTLAKTASADTDSEQPYNDDQTEDEQIEGQLSITDWIESVREEKYGKQDTREFSKAELERMLDEKDEKSKAYERIIARKKEEALNKGTEFDEAEAKRLAEAEVALDSARRDLAMRTGKAAFILEQNTVKELKNAEEEAAKEVINTSDMAVQTPQNNSKVVNFDSLVEKDNKDDLNEELSLDTAKISPVTDEMLKEYEQKQDKVDEASYAADSIAVQVNETAASYSETASVYSDSDSKEGKQMDDMDEEQSEKKLSGELAKIFRKYREMPGLEAQLVELFESLDKEMNMKTSACGNILISGNSSSDKTDLARTIVRAINYVYPDKPKKIAKTSGESINQRGIVKAMGKLKGTALIVEGAGTIQPKRINEIVSCLNEETDRMIVIFEDSDAEMNVLLNFNPELTKTFNHKITLKQYNVNELVEMAKRFARKRQYEVGDDALLELYLKIDKLHNINDNIKLDDIKEVVNKAIANSERRASRKFFGGLKKKRSDTGDVIFLTEADFKD
ncbi:putative uncharacterized protein [Eubacterium sp. CAG:248]|nr:putative uncharacterized protein [Eubacterium sp. CAG:248]